MGDYWNMLISAKMTDEDIENTCLKDTIMAGGKKTKSDKI